MASFRESASVCCRTSRPFELGWEDEEGQSTVEAAVLLPTLMFLLALLVQPICLLYTRTVMWEAASETARGVSTARDLDACRSYAIRRLGAVPEVSVFHVGGRDDWQVSVSRAAGDRVALVEIVGHVRPLPLLGDVATAFAERDEVGVVVRVSVSERTRPDWVEGDYESWMRIWG